MKKFNTIVLGCSGSIGTTLTELLKSNKTLFVSRTRPKNIRKNWKKIDYKISDNRRKFSY